MKKLFSLFVLVTISFNAIAQIILLADTAFTTDVGFGGAPASAIFEPGGFSFGFTMDNNQPYRIADSFVVPAGRIWIFDTVILYAFMDFSPTTSPITGAFLEIDSGGIGSSGRRVWGDTFTNVMANTGFTGIYKVQDPSFFDVNRPIMYVTTYLHSTTPPIAPVLFPGTYWLIYSMTGNSIYPGPYCPPKVLPGRINPPGQHGMQEAMGVWSAIYENEQGIGFNKIIKAGFKLGVNSITGTVDFTLNQNVPNPFTGSTEISFNLPTSTNGTLSIINEVGQTVATLINGRMDAGDHNVNFKSDNLPAGIYYYQLQTENGIASKRMTIVK